jgi:hypothetical protein
VSDTLIALKFLRPGAIDPSSRSAWPTPKGKRPGRWVKAGELQGSNGIHACLFRDALRRIQAECYLIEIRGDVQQVKGELVAREGRLLERLSWDKRTAVLFAADCAERVLPIFETAYPTDDRPRMATEAARSGASVPIARVAAVAAHAAARAAGATTPAAYAARAAGYAAGTAHAAGHATAAAAYAGRATSDAGERSWQLRRLRRYLQLRED